MRMQGSRHKQESLLKRIRVTRGVTSRAIKDFLEALDCPRSLAVWMLYESGEHQQLVDLDFCIDHYCNSEQTRDAYLATSFLSKFEDFHLELDRDTVAFAKFEKFELSCRSVNRLLRSDRARNWKNSELGPVLSAMAFKIDRILGDFPAQEIFDSCDWGPGASFSIKGKDASSPHKFQYETGITRRLYDLLCPGGSLAILKGYSQGWCKRLIESGFPRFEPGNRVVTVPKDSKSNRIIAVEPGFNLWFQKGVGSVMKRRLKHWRIDLTDQSRNQKLAESASLGEPLSTIDFSSASDSISYELVKEIFPPLWFELLDRLRCERGESLSRTHTWEKFSSMGNGCTFEIETLIFFTLALYCADVEGVGHERISVYGDDVIIPTQIVPLFQRFSECLGFSFNSKKSYTYSPFRESCGAHWYAGVDLKPVYLKSRLHTVQSVYRLANAVRRLAHRGMNFSSCDSRFRVAFYRLVHSVPLILRIKIPEGLGDGGFISNFDEATPKRSSTRFLQFEGYLVANVVDLSITSEVEYDGLLLSRLRVLRDRQDSVILVRERGVLSAPDLSARSSRNCVSTRDHTRIVVMTSLVPKWYDLGCWE